jgi:peptide/nickel transport system substrate-binding protein/oligopeptide transport system substrate-binding protein
MSAPPVSSRSIFVSHSRDDHEWTARFVEALRATGLDVWYDARELQGSDAWVARIQDELRHCETFLVILTPATIRSPWVQREIQLALAADKRILPILHKPLTTQQIDEIGFLRIYQWVDVVGEDSQAAAAHATAVLRGTQMTEGKIFISYQPEDSGRASRRIYDRLTARFGRAQVLMDRRPTSGDGALGQAQVDAVSGSAVVLVVIGPHWLGAKDATGKRSLDDPDDAVRVEVETALRLGKVVVPLLVEGAAMPATEDLPESLRELTHSLPVAVDVAHRSVDLERTLASAIPLRPVRYAGVRHRPLYAGLTVFLALLVLAAATWRIDSHIICPGCAVSAPTLPPAAPDSQQVLHVGITSGATPPTSLDPQLESTGFEAEFDQLIFPSLVQLDDQLRVEPWAATWTISRDGKEYTFTLRQGLMWSTGVPIRAYDFAFAINRALNPCLYAPAASLLTVIADATTFNSETCVRGLPSGSIITLIGRSLQVLDDRTLVIHLQSPAGYFLDALTTPIAWAVPQWLVDTYGATWTSHLTDAGGLGGDLFKVTSWQPGKELVLQRNDRFWGGPAKLLEIDFTVDKSDQATYAAYLAGTGDISPVSTDQYTSALHSPDFHQILTLYSFYLMPDWSLPPFNDLGMRQAFALALDKSQLVRDVFSDTGAPTNHIVPPGMPGYNPGLFGPDSTQSLKANRAHAQALAQAYASESCGGDLSRCPPVVFAVYSLQPGNRDLAQFATEVKDMWQQAMPGYPITIKAMTKSDLFNQAGHGKFQIWTADWIADFPDPWDWLSEQFLPGLPNNLGHVNLPAANALMRTADVDQNSTRRLLEYQEAEQMLVTNVAWIPIYLGQDVYVKRPYVINYQATAEGSPSSNAWQQVYIARH